MSVLVAAAAAIVCLSINLLITKKENNGKKSELVNTFVPSSLLFCCIKISTFNVAKLRRKKYCLTMCREKYDHERHLLYYVRGSIAHVMKL